MSPLQHSTSDNVVGTRRTKWGYIWTAATIVSVTMLLSVWGYLSSSRLVASAIGGLIDNGVGMAIGTGLFLAARRVIPSWAVRPLAAVVSGALSVLAGIWLGIAVMPTMWWALVFRLHPEECHGDKTYLGIVIISAMLTGLTGLLFGLGPGLDVATPPKPSLGGHIET